MHPLDLSSRPFVAAADSGFGAFFSTSAPVGQVSMQPPHSSQVVSSNPRSPAVEPDAPALRRVLRQEGWVVARAARRLGVPRHWLRYRMKRYGIRRPD